jgi:hypothetical protein
MISSYLERPLRTLEQALEDRAQCAVPPTGPNLTGLGPVELLVRLLTENIDQYSAFESPTPGPALAPAAARQRSPLDRRRAA